MKKYNLSNIMKNAWIIKKQDKNNERTFAQCLRESWNWHKLNMAVQEKLEEVKEEYNVDNDKHAYANSYSNRWENGEMKRLYFTIKYMRKNRVRKSFEFGYINLVTGEYIAA